MKLINLDMAEEILLLGGKFIVRFKKGVFDIALLLNINDDEFNEMRLLDERRFVVDKENYPFAIYNNSHPCPDNIREYASLDGNDQGVSYGLDDAINNYSDFEDMEKNRVTI